MASYWFKEGEDKLMGLAVVESTGQVISAWAGPQYPEEASLRRALCVGIMEELIDQEMEFFRYKKYFINDFHFEEEKDSGSYFFCYGGDRLLGLEIVDDKCVDIWYLKSKLDYKKEIFEDCQGLKAMLLDYKVPFSLVKTFMPDKYHFTPMG